MKARITYFRTLICILFISTLALPVRAQEYDDMYFVTKDRKKRKKIEAVDNKGTQQPQKQIVDQEIPADEFFPEDGQYGWDNNTYSSNFYNRDQTPVVNNYYGNVYNEPARNNQRNPFRSSFGFGLSPFGWSMGFGYNLWNNPYDPFNSGYFYDPFYDPFFAGPVYSYNRFRWYRPYWGSGFRNACPGTYYDYFAAPAVATNVAETRRARERSGRVIRGRSVSSNRNIQRMNSTVPNRATAMGGRNHRRASGSNGAVIAEGAEAGRVYSRKSRISDSRASNSNRSRASLSSSGSNNSRRIENNVSNNRVNRNLRRTYYNAGNTNASRRQSAAPKNTQNYQRSRTTNSGRSVNRNFTPSRSSSRQSYSSGSRSGGSRSSYSRSSGSRSSTGSSRSSSGSSGRGSRSGSSGRSSRR